MFNQGLLAKYSKLITKLKRSLPKVSANRVLYGLLSDYGSGWGSSHRDFSKKLLTLLDKNQSSGEFSEVFQAVSVYFSRNQIGKIADEKRSAAGKNLKIHGDFFTLWLVFFTEYPFLLAEMQPDNQGFYALLAFGIDYNPEALSEKELELFKQTLKFCAKELLTQIVEVILTQYRGRADIFSCLLEADLALNDRDRLLAHIEQRTTSYLADRAHPQRYLWRPCIKFLSKETQLSLLDYHLSHEDSSPLITFSQQSGEALRERLSELTLLFSNDDNNKRFYPESPKLFWGAIKSIFETLIETSDEMFSPLPEIIVKGIYDVMLGGYQRTEIETLMFDVLPCLALIACSSNASMFFTPELQSSLVESLQVFLKTPKSHYLYTNIVPLKKTLSILQNCLNPRLCKQLIFGMITDLPLNERQISVLGVLAPKIQKLGLADRVTAVIKDHIKRAASFNTPDFALSSVVSLASLIKITPDEELPPIPRYLVYSLASFFAAFGNQMDFSLVERRAGLIALDDLGFLLSKLDEFQQKVFSNQLMALFQVCLGDKRKIGWVLPEMLALLRYNDITPEQAVFVEYLVSLMGLSEKHVDPIIKTAVYICRTLSDPTPQGERLYRILLPLFLEKNRLVNSKYMAQAVVPKFKSRHLELATLTEEALSGEGSDIALPEEILRVVDEYLGVDHVVDKKSEQKLLGATTTALTEYLPQGISETVCHYLDLYPLPLPKKDPRLLALESGSASAGDPRKEFQRTTEERQRSVLTSMAASFMSNFFLPVRKKEGKDRGVLLDEAAAESTEESQEYCLQQ